VTGDVLRLFAAADLAGWTGLPDALSPASVLPPEQGAGGVGVLGDERRRAQWISIPSTVYAGGLRVWHDGGLVLVVEGLDPLDASGGPLAAPDLGEPEATLETFLGRLRLEGGERVYASRGLALRVNPENGVLLGAVGFAPTDSAEYRARLRPEVGRQRLLPNPAALGSAS
jgi:hypothetical protein